jgi:hypothetical protein
MSGKTTAAALVTAVLLSTLAPAAAGAQEGFELYGYLTSYTQASFTASADGFQEPAWGGALVGRLKGDWAPGESLSVHLEGSYTALTGIRNPGALLDAELPLESLALDHAWGLINLGNADLQFGKIPLAWGTAYVFNPSSRAAGAGLLDTVSEETPGTLAVVPSLYAGSLTFTGYAAFQDKSHRGVLPPGAESFENLPFGVKLEAFLGPFDVSAGLIREVLVVENDPNPWYDRGWYASLDADGALGPVGVYAEAVLELPPGKAPEESLEAAAGLYYSLVRREGELRLEYYHQGAGATDPGGYDLDRVFTLQQQMLAEDYLFASFDVAVADYLHSGCGGLVNLNDGSFVLLPELYWDAADNLELALGGMVFAGKEGSEFDGRDLPDYDDLTESFSLFARAKLSF